MPSTALLIRFKQGQAPVCVMFLGIVAQYTPVHSEVGVSIQKQKRLSKASFLCGKQKRTASTQWRSSIAYSGPHLCIEPQNAP